MRISPDQLDAFVSMAASDAWITEQAARALGDRGGADTPPQRASLQLRAYLDGEGDPATPGATGAGHD